MALKHAWETICLGDRFVDKINFVVAKVYFRLGFRARTFKMIIRFRGTTFPFFVDSWIDLYSLHSIFVKQEFDISGVENVKTILDLGGNIGASAVFFLVRYPEARVYVAEPSPLLQGRLGENLAHFGGRAEIISCAFWNTDGEQIEFDCAPDKHLSGSLHNPNSSAAAKVTTLRLDTFQKTLGTNIDILKFNVEGAEWEIFSSWDSSRVRYLVGEFHPDLCGHGFEEFARYFASSHRIVDDVVSRKGRHFTRFAPAA